MNLICDNTKSNRPLIKNANGTLRKGRWFLVAPDDQYFLSVGMTGGINVPFSTSLISGALAQAKAKTSWTTCSAASIGYYNASLGVDYSEDYPYNDPAYRYCYGHANIVLYSFTIPSIIQGRTLRAVDLALMGGGATMLLWGYNAGPPEEYYPQYADPWAAGSLLCGYRFSSSMPSTPAAVASSGHTNAYFTDMTNAAISAGAAIIYDKSGYWTIFDDGQLNVTTPAAVRTICQGASKVWVCAYAPSGSSFGLVSGYSRVEHLQNVRDGTPWLRVYC